MFLTAGQRNQSAEARLWSNLLVGTKQDVRPVRNVSRPTVVKVSMVYAKIVKLVRNHLRGYGI